MDAERRVHGPPVAVLVGDRRPEQRHHAVARVLVDGPLEPVYRSIEELIVTTAVVGTRAVEADLFLLGARAPLVHLLHSVGLKVFGWTANNADEWLFLQSLGVDGIYTNDVPLGVDLQAIASPGPPSAGIVPAHDRGHAWLKIGQRR